MYKAIIYDCDGTLLDSKKLTINAYEKMVERKLTQKESDDIFHQTRVETFEMLNIEECEKNILKIEKLYEEGIQTIKTFDGILEMLQAISNMNIHQAMATNRDFLSAKFAFESNNLSKYLLNFISASDVEKPKPSGEMLLKYIKKHNLNTETTLFVGNSITDHMAAIDVNMDFAYCDWGTEHFYEKSAIILKEPADLVGVLGGIKYDKNLCAQRI